MLCVIAFQLSLAAPSQYEVTDLPGWGNPLKSKVYSGFCPAGVPPNGHGTQYVPDTFSLPPHPKLNLTDDLPLSKRHVVFTS